MKRFMFAFCLFLSACGSGGADKPQAVQTPIIQVPSNPVPAVNPDTITAVTVNEDHSQGDYFLQNVTFNTANGKEYNIEYCNDLIKVGDVLTLKEYGVGTTLMIINGAVVGNIIDEQATEAYIAAFTLEQSKAYDDAYDWQGLEALLYKDGE